jgi:hypothetical protein
MSATKEGIETVVNGILAFAATEDAQAFNAVASNEVVKRALEHANEGRFEEFDFELLHPFEQVVDGLLAGITNSNEAQFLLKHSSFVESHFNRLIEKYEGSPCCSDKSRTIMQSLIHFHIDGKPIQFNYGQEYTYHLPKRIFTTHDMIVEFATSLHHLFYGNPEKYLNALQGVIAAAEKAGKD